MVITFVSWCLITWFAFCMGVVFHKIWFLVSKQKKSTEADQILLMGICVLTVYAEIFSLFCGIGGGSANLLLIAICFIITWCCRKEFRQTLSSFRGMKKRYWLAMAAILIIMLAIGASETTVYDTGLYHAQAVRWIEEYGVVKGLGCLHNRFAYNSAFLVLQALFGYGHLIGAELHSLNAYLALILTVWAVFTLTFWEKKTISLSDMGRLLFLVFLFSMKDRLSSPGTDFFAVGMAIYILTKWLALSEQQCEEVEPYVSLCFLAAYAVTLKFSAAAVVLLAGYPLYLLIRGRKYKLICISVIIGLIIAVPFLIRNVIISGYLLYPFPAIDIFPVDWKMAIEDVVYDKNEITAWGRGLREVDQYAYPFRQWFPIWWDTLSLMSKMSFVLFLISLAVMLIRVACLLKNKPVRERDIQMMTVYLTESSLTLMWFFGAPITRYGGIFLLLVPFTLAGEFLSLYKPVWISYIGVYAILFLAVFAEIKYSITLKTGLIVPEPYTDYEVKSCEFSGMTFYYPAEGDQVGYQYFPSTPYKERLEDNMIEFRAEGDLSQGFRLKNGMGNVIIN